MHGIAYAVGMERSTNIRMYMSTLYVHDFLQVPDLERNTGLYCSKCILMVALHLDSGQYLPAGKDSENGAKAAGWLYGSPRHAAEAGRQPSREGSVEDGELPRVPVAFSLAPGKAAAPQIAAPAASEAARPAESAEKGSPAPAPGDASSTPLPRHNSQQCMVSVLPSSLQRPPAQCTEALRAWSAAQCNAGSGRLCVGLCTR